MTAAAFPFPPDVVVDFQKPGPRERFYSVGWYRVAAFGRTDSAFHFPPYRYHDSSRQSMML